jgi:hypothetical protein
VVRRSPVVEGLATRSASRFARIAHRHPVRRAVICHAERMSILQRMIGLVRRPMAEWHARGRDLGQLVTELEASGQALDARLADLADTPAHRAVLAHWIGIERWGQRRLRVALGEPLLDDGHHPYKPDEAGGTAALRQSFAATRSTTIGLAHELREAGVDPATTVRHNDLGDLSIAAWLAYLLQHPEQEARARLRP